MRNSNQANVIELMLPASKELMLVARLTTSGVLARAGLTLDVHDEMKLAVEEACLCLMTQDTVPDSILIRYEFMEKSIVVRVSCAGECRCGCGCSEDKRMPIGELEVIQCILQSLAEVVDISTSEEKIESISLKADLPS